ncbi:MAG: beta-lactamase family protein [Lachnospiraceae bacterium]|nr:beta-lactamase family protein [Candidatus Merdinaster equi]
MRKTDYFDKIIEKEIDANNLSGANLTVFKDDHILYRRSYGMADIERGIPMSHDTIFRIFSMTKPITAVSALILAERGIIDLYDPVSWYIPSFAVSKSKIANADGTLTPASSEMRIKDLMNMASGLSYPDITPAGQAVAKVFDEMIASRNTDHVIGTVEFAQKLGEVPLCFEPGTSWCYGTSADVLGAIIEIVSGMRLSAFFEKEIFAPLGMTDTGFYVPEEKRNRFAQLYRCDDKGIRPEPGENLAIEPLYDHLPAFESGGAGLVSTVDDYLKFARMLLGKGTYGGVRILSPGSVEYLHTPGFDYESFKRIQSWDSLKGYNYGNLVRIMEVPADNASAAAVGEYGWDGWTGTYFVINPRDNMILMYFVNRCDTGCNNVTRRIKNIAYSLE